MDPTTKLLVINNFQLYNFCNFSPLSSDLNENRGLKKLSEENLEVLISPLWALLYYHLIIGSTQAGQEDQGDQGQAAGGQG